MALGTTRGVRAGYCLNNLSHFLHPTLMRVTGSPIAVGVRKARIFLESRALLRYRRVESLANKLSAAEDELGGADARRARGLRRREVAPRSIAMSGGLPSNASIYPHIDTSKCG